MDVVAWGLGPQRAALAQPKSLPIIASEAAMAKARAAGATEVAPVSEDHGWRIGRVSDPFGHDWEIGKQLTS
jgi:PhnB protein